MSFSDLLLAEPILRAVISEGYTTATPIQAAAIPHILSGKDVLGCAQTGTGKTAAFALPILHRLSITPRPVGGSRPRALVLCPTRELATQIGDSFRVYGKNVSLRHTTIYGGVGIRPQMDAMRRGVDVVIATPGRLLDLIGQNCCDLTAIELLVLDEADRMLDMGFIVDIRKIISYIQGKRQTLLFSATMPPEIRRLAVAILRDPVTVQVAQQSRSADNIDQSVYYVGREEKPLVLAQLVKDVPMSRPIVFTRTKRGADKLVRRLYMSGIRSEAIHGNKSQNARQRALDGFRSGRIHVLVATDVASRGIDVDGITHVVNYDVTDEPETYIHRIGRTARAGASGSAITLCDPQEKSDLRAIERLMGHPLPVRTIRLNQSAAQTAAEAKLEVGPHSLPYTGPQSAPAKQQHKPQHSATHGAAHTETQTAPAMPAERMRPPQHPIHPRHHAKGPTSHGPNSHGPKPHRKGQDRRGAGRFRMA